MQDVIMFDNTPAGSSLEVGRLGGKIILEMVSNKRQNPRIRKFVSTRF